MRFLSTFVAIDKEIGKLVEDSHVVTIVLNGPAYKGDPFTAAGRKLMAEKGS